MNARLQNYVPVREIHSKEGVKRKTRHDPYRMYGCPRATDATAWLWMELPRKRYVVALASESRLIDRRWYGCFHALPSRSAAEMLIRMVRCES